MMFDKEELDILEAFENDTIVKSINADEEIAVAKRAAKEYLSKSKNITLISLSLESKGFDPKVVRSLLKKLS